MFHDAKRPRMVDSSAAHLHGQLARRRLFGRVSLAETTYPPHMRLPAHSHPCAYISFVVAGAYNEIVGRTEVACGEDTVRFHHDGEEHANRFSRHGATCLNIDLDRDLIDGCDLTTPRGEPITVDSASYVAMRMRRELWRPDATSALVVEQLALELVDACAARTRVRAAAAASAPLRHALDYIDAHLSADLRLPTIARVAGVHETHLARLFRARLGCTAGDVVRARRVAAVQRALRRQPEASVAALAAWYGFADHAHLTRTFRRVIGVSPSEFRVAIRATAR